METLIKNLKAKGYIVDCFETKEEAAKFVDAQLDQTTIGIGGSVTVEQMNLFPMLSAHNTVYWHNHKPENMTVMETRQAASRAPIYISSANAISEDGIIINIDACGNRVAATTFGPNKVYFVIGKNKIAPDYEAAMYRARNVAAPLNAQRLGRKTPCAVNGDRCFDCQSPERICRNFSEFRERPAGIEYHVILINEALGY